MWRTTTADFLWALLMRLAEGCFAKLSLRRRPELSMIRSHGNGMVAGGRFRLLVAFTVEEEREDGGDAR